MAESNFSAVGSLFSDRLLGHEDTIDELFSQLGLWRLRAAYWSSIVTEKPVSPYLHF